MSITRASIFMIVYSYLPIIFTLCLISSDAKFPIRLAKSFLYGGISSGIMMITIAFLSIIVMGPDQSARQIYATYALAKKISVGNFLQRIEVTVAFLWFISIYFKLTLYFHAAMKGIASLFQIQNYKSLSTPIGVIVTVLSL
ncbi:GerAB/ArcD/ProY family transporter, partial [Paenibacillus sp. TAF58]